MIFEKQIEKIYRSQVFTRYDETGTVYYFSAADFPGLNAMPLRFAVPEGHTLQGYFYSYDTPKPDRLIVFDHGMGGGHRAYMKEIERLARQGYLVFAYDHTGCMESGGASTCGFARSLNDLDACLRALKAHELCKERSLSVMGHSWGAFSTMNIPALHPDVTHIVAMSGFVSVEQMLLQSFGGLLKGYRKHIYGVEQAANPEHVGYSALENLKNTQSKALIIHSKDDSLVRQALHFDVLRAAVSDNPNVHFLLLDGKGHNPNYTVDAVQYKDAFFATLTKKLKRKKLITDEQKQVFVQSYDWNRMTAQDETVWVAIFAHLES